MNAIDALQYAIATSRDELRHLNDTITTNESKINGWKQQVKEICANIEHCREALRTLGVKDE